VFKNSFLNFVKKFDNKEQVEPQNFTFDEALMTRASRL